MHPFSNNAVGTLMSEALLIELFSVLSINCFCLLFCSTSNHRCAETLGDYLAERNIMGICKLNHGVNL